MKRIAAIIAAVALFASCNGPQKTQDVQAEMDAIVTEFQAIFASDSLSEDEMMEKATEYLLSQYNKHKKDSVGLELFTPLALQFLEPEEALKLYEKSSKLIKSDESIQRRMESIKNVKSTSKGCPYKEVTGVDALTGEPLSLSQFTNGNKPLIVDFWASWCSPCRNEIRNHLLGMYEEGSVDIVGIAVWEECVEDTQKAMAELGVKWPVIFCGGREDSPSVAYGVSGIPTLFRIENGIIEGRGHSVTEIGF